MYQTGLKFTFNDFHALEALELGVVDVRPHPSEALALLHRLASGVIASLTPLDAGLFASPLSTTHPLLSYPADAGIITVMEKRQWSVGRLSEMPPDGVWGGRGGARA